MQYSSKHRNKNPRKPLSSKLDRFTSRPRVAWMRRPWRRSANGQS